MKIVCTITKGYKGPIVAGPFNTSKEAHSVRKMMKRTLGMKLLRKHYWIHEEPIMEKN